MRALRALDADGHDHGIRLVGDHRGAVIHLHQRAGHRDAAFREDHHRLLAGDQLDEVARTERLGRIDRDVADQLEEDLRPPGLGDAGVDGEGRVDRQHRMQQRAIDQADMVRRDQHAGAGRRQVFQAAHFGAEQRAEQHGAEVPHAFLAPLVEHEPDRPEARQRESEEDPGDRDACGLQAGHTQRTDHHEGSLQDIAGGDDTGSLIRFRPSLHGCEGRNNEQAAAEGEQGKIDQHARASPGADEAKRGEAFRGLCRGDGPGEIQSEHAHEDGADRHQCEVRPDMAEMGSE